MHARPRRGSCRSCAAPSTTSRTTAADPRRLPAYTRTVLTESAARWLLVLHTALGVAAVGAATHLVIWLRAIARGQLGRLRSARRFAWIVLALQLAAFAAGNVMYPTYKTAVRA